MRNVLSCALLGITLAGPAVAADEFTAELTALANDNILVIIQAPEILDAVKTQNVETAAYDAARIEALDQAWRAQVKAAERPLVAETMDRPASQYLAAVRDNSGGLFTEIIVMDAKGLNVAQSDVTSDYWQGDEAKWTETFPKGKDAVHVSEVEMDESTLTRQSQVSRTIVDPATGEPIGAITVGVNVELLN